MSSETQKTMVRFDFSPGATAEEIAAALTALRDRVRREKAEASSRAHGEAPSPTNENGTTA
jgi:cysteine sulfinate desulfinase/cysteine desulfurase-like protein